MYQDDEQLAFRTCYADGLSLTINEPCGMQIMLERLRANAERKWLTVNTEHAFEQWILSFPAYFQ
eukprot:scaffold148013_cov19-Tisochrysis_lutea.AAC.1